MNKNVVPLRRSVLPQNIFDLVERFMLGDLEAIHIIGVTVGGEVVSTSAGKVPSMVERLDKARGLG